MPDLFDPPPRHAIEAAARHKIFFAVRPEPEAAGRMFRFAEAQRRRLGLTGRPTPPERLHISLNGLGRHVAPPERLIAAATGAVSGLAWLSFIVALDRLGTWGRGAGKRPLVLWSDEGLIGVSRLHEAIQTRLVGARVVRGPERAFCPHLTLLRDAAVAPERRVGPFMWRVRELVLLDSLHGEGRHEVLDRWPLGERPRCVAT